jgi:phage terminase large subunit-like protein
MTTKTSPTSSADDLMREWLGDEAGPALLAYLRTSKRSDGSLHWPDVDEQICSLIRPRFLSPPPNVPGAYFDITKFDRFVRFGRLTRHIKGAWAGRPFELEMWQIVFVFGPVFGWQNEFGYRLIRILYQEVGKKNGKSTSAAVLGLYLASADGEMGAEVGSLAGNKDQARAVYDVAYHMVKGSPALRKRLRPYKNQVVYEDRASWFRVMSSAGDLKAGLNIHGAVVDELLVHKTRDLVDNIEGATASRMQPLVAYLTTSGLDDPGSIYGEKRTYAERVALETVEDPSWWVAIYTIDEEDHWDDPEVWVKANPNLGVSVQLSYLQNKVKQAKANPAAINKFLRDHLDVRTGQFTRWISIEEWDRSNARWLSPLPGEFIGKPVYLGLDLASTTDLAAVGLVFPQEVVDPENPDLRITILDVLLKAWTPLATIEQRAERDNAPYLQWIEEGYLTGVEGNVIDYDDIEEQIKVIGSMYQVLRLNFDRWGSKQLVQHLSDHFGDDVVFDMGQGFASMTAPMKEVERFTLSHRIRHQGNPLLRWAVQSLAIQSDAAGNVKPNREKSTGRIDPFVAMTMGVDGYMRTPVFVSAYERDEDRSA